MWFRTSIEISNTDLAQPASLMLSFFPLQAVPPLEVTDLIEEIRDGHVLLSLLEVLLGKTLVSLVLDSLFSSSLFLNL